MSEYETIRRSDYKPCNFFTPEIHMEFHLDDEGKEGQARLITKTKVQRNGDHNEPLVLDGTYFDLKSIKIDGQEIGEGEDLASGYIKDDNTLTLEVADDEFELEVETLIDAKANEEGEGIYYADNTYSSQCEAEGFRRMTYSVDRPDNMAVFTTDIVYDPDKVTHALSNGNLVNEQTLDDGLVKRTWFDPTRKPTYLFALCGNNFVKIDGDFKTMSGRDVALEFFAQEQYRDGLQHALESLQRAMKWDEDVWGCEYDLDSYMVVVDDGFNLGAMENKGLNIFNPKYLLAHPEYSTDMDFYNVESVIGHEYFHNWTGNRVTVSSWFDLTLKEGLTVYRDQSFSADMSDPLAARIIDVNGLRTSQFSEDDGPMVHAPRPEEVKEMNILYSSTVYNKGAEINRVLRALLNDQPYRKGTDLYFERHDGQAVTLEEWVQAHADAHNINFDQFMYWYTQGGRPRVDVTWDYDDENGEFVLKCQQKVPYIEGVSNGLPRVIPIEFGLLDKEGNEVVAETLVFNKDKQEFRIKAPKDCVPSLFRDFSAPVSVKSQYTNADFSFLVKHDTNDFNRWESMQRLMVNDVLARMNAESTGKPFTPDAVLCDLFKEVISDDTLTNHVKALILTPPNASTIANEFEGNRDPVLIADKLQDLKSYLAKQLEGDWLNLYQHKTKLTRSYEYNKEEVGRRAIANLALSFVKELDHLGAYVSAKTQYGAANNFNDRLSAYKCIMNSDAAVQDFDHFVDDMASRFEGKNNPLDNWAIQTVLSKHMTLDRFKSFLGHDGNKGNETPNRMRALYMSFSMNDKLFHAEDGSGYRVMTDVIKEWNTRNPTLTTRFVGAFQDVDKFTADIQERMRPYIEEVAAIPDINKGLSEIVEKILGEKRYAQIRKSLKSPQELQSELCGVLRQACEAKQA